MTKLYTIAPVTEKRTISYHSGRTMTVRGFRVVWPNGNMGKGFIQGTAQKWTPALEAGLRKEAEDFAASLNEHFGLSDRLHVLASAMFYQD